jgi:pyruvyl transferase EpsI
MLVWTVRQGLSTGKRIAISTIVKCKWLLFKKHHAFGVVFIATPVHGNCGDHAIVFAQYLLFESIGLGKSIFEIAKPIYDVLRNWLKKNIRPQDMIIIDGGGNIGTLWLEEEYKMRDIVQRFRNNRVYIFPQTAYFEESQDGEKEFRLSKATYESHQRLTIFARDRSTQRLFSQRMPTVRCYYTPDIALYIQNATILVERQGVQLCFRKDKEKVLTDGDTEKLTEALANRSYSIMHTSLNLPGRISKHARQRYLMEKWNEFSSAKLVVTDCLHGMIFAAITSTPCIAFDNISHKVRDGYWWLKHLPYIHFCATVEEALSQVDELYIMDTQHYDIAPLMPYFVTIEKEMLNNIS